MSRRIAREPANAMQVRMAVVDGHNRESDGYVRNTELGDSHRLRAAQSAARLRPEQADRYRGGFLPGPPDNAVVGDRRLRGRHLRQCAVIPGRPRVVLHRQPGRHRDPSELPHRRLHRGDLLSAVLLLERRRVDLRVHGAALRRDIPQRDFRGVPGLAGADLGRDPVRDFAGHPVHNRGRCRDGHCRGDDHRADLHHDGRHHGGDLDRRDPGGGPVRRGLHRISSPCWEKCPRRWAKCSPI